MSISDTNVSLSKAAFHSGLMQQAKGSSGRQHGQSRRQVGAMATFAQVRAFCSLTVREYGLNKYSHAASGRVDTSHNTEAEPFLSRTLKK